MSCWRGWLSPPCGNRIETARRNQLLNGLSEATLGELSRDLELRQMHIRDQIVRRSEVADAVYFPLNCVLSTVAQGASGEVVEVATIGNEGMSGVSLFLGVEASSTLETFTQVAGEALWMRAREFRGHLIIRHACSLITIVDRARLEERRSCECYRIIHDEYARLLPPRRSAGTSVD